MKDLSGKGPEYTDLRGIRLGVASVVPAGSRAISVEGQTLTAKVFRIVTREVVPFVQGTSVYNNVNKDLAIHYELMVAADEGGRVHDRLIEVLAEISRRPGKDRDFSNVGLVGGGEKYLLFSGRSSMPNYVWFDDRVVVVRFLGFGEKRKDRTPDTGTFWDQKIAFYHGDMKLKPASVTRSFGETFLDRLRSGEFARTGKTGQ